MRLVAIDIGTTYIKCGLFENAGLKETWRYPTKDSGVAGADILKRASNCQFAMSSVAPNAASDLEKTLGKDIFRIKPEGQSFIMGFKPEYGADRVADTVAARKFYAPGQNLAVFALGTCTVLTTIRAVGVVDGGFITLGYHRMVSELQVASPLVDALKEIDYRKYALDFGFTTGDQIINGAAVAQIGIVERWLRLAREKLGQPLISVATGGNSILLADQEVAGKKLVDHIDPDLTLKGIHLIYAAKKG